LQLSTGENYLQYQKPDGSSSTKWTQGTNSWTSYTSTPSQDGTRGYTAFDSLGKQFLTSRF
jgi:hypothetical protein